MTDDPFSRPRRAFAKNREDPVEEPQAEAPRSQFEDDLSSSSPSIRSSYDSLDPYFSHASSPSPETAAPSYDQYTPDYYPESQSATSYSSDYSSDYSSGYSSESYLAADTSYASDAYSQAPDYTQDPYDSSSYASESSSSYGLTDSDSYSYTSEASSPNLNFSTSDYSADYSSEAYSPSERHSSDSTDNSFAAPPQDEPASFESSLYDADPHQSDPSDSASYISALYEESDDKAAPDGVAWDIWEKEFPRSLNSPQRGEALDAAAMEETDNEKDTSHFSLGRSIGLAAASTVLPGIGLLWARSGWAKIFGVLVPLSMLALIGWVGFSALTDKEKLLGFVLNPTVLAVLIVGIVGFALIWVMLIMSTHMLTRPRALPGLKRLAGALMVGVLSLTVSAPMAVAAHYSYEALLVIKKTFQSSDDIKSDSKPEVDAAKDNPWADHPQLNILLLGGDSAKNRSSAYGTRTDAIIVASVNTTTGATTLIQIPRNLQYAPFPAGSEMASVWPNGFTGPGDPAEWFANAIWPAVELNHPDLFKGQTYRGAEALKQGAEGITGLKIHYFAMLNMEGLEKLIDALGGVTVNINQRLPMGGDTTGRPPFDWLEQGPNQKLDGLHAMWYARSRSTTDDFSRMARQSCLVKAVIDSADPATLITGYEGIASAAGDLVVTDVPREVLQPLVGLFLKVKDAPINRVFFGERDGVRQNGYSYSNPDFTTMRQAVEDAIAANSKAAESAKSPASGESKAPAKDQDAEPAPSKETTQNDNSGEQPSTEDESGEDVKDACAYDPVG